MGNIIDIPQGKKPISIPRNPNPRSNIPVSVVVTPKPAPKPVPSSKPKPKTGGSIIDVILGGVLPIATNPIIPGVNLPIVNVSPGTTVTPIGGVDLTKPITLPAFPDLKLPGLPAFPDLGLPSLGKFFDDLKVGGGLILLGIGGLLALLIITRRK